MHCLTGRGKYFGNLTAEEMADQFASSLADSPILANGLLSDMHDTIFQISWMGEGEGLLNTENVISGVKLINSKFGSRMPLTFSISTIGIKEGLLRLLDEDFSGISLHLQVSMHYADKRREKFIPFAVGENAIEETLPLAAKFSQRWGDRLGLNFVMINGPDYWRNNRARDAANTVNLLRHTSPTNLNEVFRVKISPFNGGGGLLEDFLGGSHEEFAAELHAHGVNVQIVSSKGVSRDAGCGRLLTRILPAPIKSAV